MKADTDRINLAFQTVTILQHPIFPEQNLGSTAANHDSPKAMPIKFSLRQWATKTPYRSLLCSIAIGCLGIAVPSLMAITLLSSPQKQFATSPSESTLERGRR